MKSKHRQLKTSIQSVEESDQFVGNYPSLAYFHDMNFCLGSTLDGLKVTEKDAAAKVTADEA